MAYRSDHDFRTKLYRDVTRGMENYQESEFHDYLQRNCSEEKDSMTYQKLLEAAQEFMSSNYPEYSWNGKAQKWS
jgi:hypothetical protein